MVSFAGDPCNRWLPSAIPSWGLWVLPCGRSDKKSWTLRVAPPATPEWSQLRSLTREEPVAAQARHCRPLEGQLLSTVEIVSPETTVPSICMLSSVFGFNRYVNNDLVEKRAGRQWTGHFPHWRVAQMSRFSCSALRWLQRSTKRTEGPALSARGSTTSEEGFSFRLLTRSASRESAEAPVCTFPPGMTGWCACLHWLWEKELVREGAKTVMKC